MDRRQFVREVLAGFPVYALLAEVGIAGAATRSSRGTDRWIAHQHEIAVALARGEIAPGQWRAEVESLAGSVDVPQLMADLARADIRVVGRALPSYPIKRTIRFRDATGARRRLRYAVALFTFDRRNVVTPHAHRNMVSAHLVVEGAFRVRTFDRVRDADGAIVIRPSGDGAIRVGDVSTIGTRRDNIHWFVPRTARAATLDVIVSGLDRTQPRYAIEAVDPVRGARQPDGTIRAPILDFAEASRIYTPDV